MFVKPLAVLNPYHWTANHAAFEGGEAIETLGSL